MNINGRPSGYRADLYPILASYWAQDGLTDEQMAARLHVSRQTFFAWKQAHPEFLDALKTTKEQADAQVEQSLFQKAIKGDVTACIFWLKNRQPAKWRDRQEVETTAITDVAVAVKRLIDA